MVNPVHPPRPVRPIVRKRFHFLLAALLGQLVISPFLTGVGSVIVQDLIFLAILLTALGAVRQSRLYPFILGLAVLCAVSLLGKYTTNQPFIAIVGDAVGVVVILLTAVEVSRYLAMQRRVDLDTVFGGLCVYLFIGAMWYSLYGLLVRLEPGSFDYTVHAHHGVALASQGMDRLLFFYSYVTLLTTGYGDIVPLSPTAQTLSVLEGITGQFYLVFFMARLVGLHVAARQEPVAHQEVSDSSSRGPTSPR